MKTEKIIEVKTQNLNEFQQTAKKLTPFLTTKSVVALSGPMGAGKTEIVKAFCHLNGILMVVSPTFAIHQHYESKSGLSFDHLDLYRLKDEDELESTGFWSLFSQTTGLIFIEWSENMNLEHIPWTWDLFVLKIETTSENMRTLQFSKRVVVGT